VSSRHAGPPPSRGQVRRPRAVVPSSGATPRGTLWTPRLTSVHSGIAPGPGQGLREKLSGFASAVHSTSAPTRRTVRAPPAAPHGVRIQQRRRAAADVDRVQPERERPPLPRPPQAQLLPAMASSHSRHGRRARGGDGEVAVAAAPDAERNVYVQVLGIHGEYYPPAGRTVARADGRVPGDGWSGARTRTRFRPARTKRAPGSCRHPSVQLEFQQCAQHPSPAGSAAVGWRWRRRARFLRDGAAHTRPCRVLPAGGASGLASCASRRVWQTSPTDSTRSHARERGHAVPVQGEDALHVRPVDGVRYAVRRDDAGSMACSAVRIAPLVARPRRRPRRAQRGDDPVAVGERYLRGWSPGRNSERSRPACPMRSCSAMFCCG
jgi:hypothetical protein